MRFVAEDCVVGVKRPRLPPGHLRLIVCCKLQKEVVKNMMDANLLASFVDQGADADIRPLPPKAA
ncbi:hypothetical protein A6X21_01525 [Planctopirus hydrillae]|uniref:Uncharacterized protein n=1 Tax=Planctopirus hydrillae TaxID=1841610 RepID=A0A1C3EU62_9PLAN|nr:hypothetical protein A6X21_01525 [Planctopirus hydrillae]